MMDRQFDDTRHLRLCAVLLLAMAVLLLLALGTGTARAVTTAPAWTIESLPFPTDLAPGGTGEYEVVVANATGAPIDNSQMKLLDTLPAGLEVEKLELRSITGQNPVTLASALCGETKSGGAVTVLCTIPSELNGAQLSREAPQLRISVEVPPAAGEAPLLNSARVEGGGATAASARSTNAISAAPAPGGFSAFEAILSGPAGQDVDQAALHPFEYTTRFQLNTKPEEVNPNTLTASAGLLRNIEVPLPPGFIGDPTATSLCSAQGFAEREAQACPDGSAVGIVSLRIEGQRVVVPIYNLVPPAGMPAQLGFVVAGLPFYIDTEVRSGDDYGITTRLRNVATVERALAGRVTIWGAPADPSHDRLRGTCLNRNGLSTGSCPAGVPVKPFLRLPTSCESSLGFSMGFDVWGPPHPFFSAGSTLPAPSGCSSVEFKPSLTFRPDTTVSDSATGVKVDLHVPQNAAPESLAVADLRDLTVKLPAGVTVNPSSGNGLAGCSPAQVGLISAKGVTPVKFTPGPAQCPDASKVGSVRIDTPLLDHPIDGAVYVATQGDNPFGSLIAIYVTAFDQQTGVVVKVAGRIDLDPTTGQVTATFTDNPQVPFEDLETVFFSGPRAALRTPFACGTYTTTTDMRPWSAPESGPDATPSDSFAVSGAPGGGACIGNEDEAANRPAFEAGTKAPVAASYSPFVLNLGRDDGTQNFRALNVTLPPGLTGRLAGLQECSEADVARAAARSHEGEGSLEQRDPSCPAASEVGRVTVAAGAGPLPVSVVGHAYLGGPYKGAPLSLDIITPAVAGPFDLGVVVVRTALYVNEETARITARSDPFPTILDGLPLDLRSIALETTASQFTLNPTNCQPMAVTGEEVSTLGHVAPLDSRFQAGGCTALPFEPNLRIRLKGATRRIGHPALKAVLTAKPGEANIGRAQVNLPHGEFLDQSNLNKTCTKPVLLAGNCPRSSVYGKARAWTPLLAKPLEGPVYLVGGYGYKLPALVAELNGQIRILLVGKVDSGKNRGIRSTFEVVPDAPVSRFVLEMKGGKKYGLLENSENLCRASKADRRAIVRFTGQNGKVDHYKPVVQNQCGKKAKKRHARHTASRAARPGGRG